MSAEEIIREGQILAGPLFSEPMRVETVRADGADAWVVGLVGSRSEQFRRVTLRRADLADLTITGTGLSYDGDGRLLRLGLQAYSLGIAYEFDPYFGLSISRVDPLPHQLEAVSIDTIEIGGAAEGVGLDTPLDFTVEREAADGTSAAWRSEALKYVFGASGGGTKLAAREYQGRDLDWYHFDVVESATPAAPPAAVETRMIATTMTFRGAPHPRWWRFEDGAAYFDSPRDPEPNILSMLLPEFFFLDINNWYLAPLLQTAGTIREITRLSIVDGFGVVTEIKPSTGTGDAEWAMFSLARADRSGTPRDGGGAFLYVPNIAIEVLDNDEVEEVLFTRDEEANLVWASERLVTLSDGTQVRHGDGTAIAPIVHAADPRPQFRFRSDVPAWFVPYTPRFIRLSPTSGEIYLRRARTVESASRTNPQYRSRIVAESWRVDEAEVPRSGVRVRRTHRYARGSDGTGYFWIGRYKQTAPRNAAPGLRFDYLDE